MIRGVTGSVSGVGGVFVVVVCIKKKRLLHSSAGALVCGSAAALWLDAV